MTNSTGEPGIPNDIAAPPPSTPPPPENEQVQSDETSRDERHVEEEEQPFWASFEEDKSVPGEEELKKIEQQPVELDALDRKFNAKPTIPLRKRLHFERQPLGEAYI